MRDGHEPNEAEEQRPCCVPIEPVHVISSPKDRREQEGYQNSGSFGENGSQLPIHDLSRQRLSSRNTVTALPDRMAVTAGRLNNREHRRRDAIPRRGSVYYFSVQREIETVALRVLRHAEADEHLDHEEDDQAGDGIIDKDDSDPDALIEELTNVSLQNTRRSAVLLDGEHPGQQRPDDAANRMHAEAIQRIVIAEHALQTG